MNPTIEPIVLEFKRALQELYGHRLHEVVLYGSYARGDFHEESDIDLMVLLRDEQVDTFTEIRRMSLLLTQFTLRYNLVLSPLPVASRKFQLSLMPVYQEARREGIYL